MAWGALSAGFDWPHEPHQVLAALEQTHELSVRCDLARLLGEYADEDLRQALLALLHDPSAALRREAVRALARRDDAAARRGLTQALTDAAPEVRSAAAEGLGALRVRTGAPGLIRALGDPTPEVRAASAASLGVLGDSSALGPLAAALDDDTTEVRVAAARGLLALGGPEALPGLLARLRDPAPEMRALVVGLVARAQPGQAESLVAQALDDPQESVRLEALRALLELPRPLREETRARLTTIEAHARPQEASAAQLALHPHSAPGEPRWVELLEQTDRAPTTGALPLVAALERALPAGEELAVDPLLIWLGRAPQTLRGRIAALVARARPRSATKLIPLLKDPDAAVRLAAAQGLVTSQEPAAAQALLAALVDPDRATSRMAAQALATNCTAAALQSLVARDWRHADFPRRERALLALAGCLERLPPQDLEPPARDRLRRDLLAVFEAAAPDSERASLAARALAPLGSAPVFDKLRAAYPQAPLPLRVALLRATLADHSTAAQALRARAARPEAPAAERATAWMAQWRAQDHALAARSEPLTGALAWPLGPVAAFVAASDRALDGARLCVALDSREPLTRANARAASSQTDDASNPCAERCAALPSRAAARPAPPAPRLDWYTPGSFRALVFSDGRVLVSVADGAGSVTWAGLPQIVTENPWQQAYGAE